MGEASVQEEVDRFESFLREAIEFTYQGFPTSVRDHFIQNDSVARWNIVSFLQAYLNGGVYPSERLPAVVHHLFDLKLELYYLVHVDLGLYNEYVFARGYDQNNPHKTPHRLLTRFSFDQSIIAKSRILWERFMNFIYHLHTGVLLESRVSKKKSKRRVFFDLIASTPEWTFLQPYESVLEDYENQFRTPEFHKGSIFRAELLGRRSTEPDKLIQLLNRFMNTLWENTLCVVSGQKPCHFTDLHLSAEGHIDERYK